MEQAILEFEHVTGKNRKFHLEDITFSLPAGYLMGLAGKNGAGKTTLFDYIMNPRKQYTGIIRVCGVDIRENHTDLRGKLGFVSDKNPFLTECTAHANAQVLGSAYEQFDMDMFTYAMKKMELSVGKNVGQMSRGEMVRFQTAFAMAHRSVLYLLDEATAGMDPVFRIDYFKLLHEIIAEEQSSVLMATHIEAELQRNMDYTGILEKGRLVHFGENIPD